MDGLSCTCLPKFSALAGVKWSGGFIRATSHPRDRRWLTTFSTSKAEAIFPVTLHGAIVGTIDVESDCVGAFTNADEDFLRGAAVMLQPLWTAPNAG